jgi:hypothetical protein
MPSNLVPTAGTTRVVERDSPGLARYWAAFNAGIAVQFDNRRARVVAIQPRADGAFDVEFEDVARR